MYKCNRLTALQLEWLEATKYDEYLFALNRYRSNPNRNNQVYWNLKEKEYLRVVNQIENSRTD